MVWKTLKPIGALVNEVYLLRCCKMTGVVIDLMHHPTYSHGFMIVVARAYLVQSVSCAKAWLLAQRP